MLILEDGVLSLFLEDSLVVFSFFCCGRGNMLPPVFLLLADKADS